MNQDTMNFVVFITNAVTRAIITAAWMLSYPDSMGLDEAVKTTQIHIDRKERSKE